MIVLVSKTIISESFSYNQWYLYSSVRKFVIEGTEVNIEKLMNNNRFSVPSLSIDGNSFGRTEITVNCSHVFTIIQL